MDKLVYLYYIILPVLLFFGAKIMKKGEWNEEVMSFDHTKAFLGFASIIIIFHHASQRTCAPWLSPFRIHHGLDLFVYVGYLMVAAFFFCSGYGMYSAHGKKGFFDKYFKRRILTLIIPTVIMWFVFFGAEKIRNIRIEKPILINTYSYIWYIPCMIWMYLAFYISFHLVKKEKAQMPVLWTLVILYMVLAAIFSPGTWWFNTPHLFAVGAGLAKNKEKRFEKYKKGYALRIILFTIITVAAFYVSNYLSALLATIDNKYNPFVHWLIELSGQLISSYTFAILVMLIGMKIKIGNKILKLLGGFTLETYLVHPFFVHAFCFSFIRNDALPLFYIKNQFLYVLAIIVISLPIAFLLNKVLRILKKPA
ncbi:MAG: acyltransferase [Eubacterium sp.]|nr:acyltransferase [Eubacterium sp.]